MPTTLRFALALLTCAAVAPAFAGQEEMARKSYYDMCVQATSMPKPFGEWDVKGNAKLPAYCECFAQRFLERAKASMGKPAPSLEQSNKEELALRNACRSKTGLPAAVEPKM